MPSKHDTFTNFIDWPRNAHKRLLRGRRSPRCSSLLSARNRQKSLSHPHHTALARLGPAFNQPPSAAHGNATRLSHWPRHGREPRGSRRHPEKLLTRAAPKFPATGPRCVSPSSSWISAPPSSRQHRRKEKKGLVGGSADKGRCTTTKNCATSTPVGAHGKCSFSFRKAVKGKRRVTETPMGRNRIRSIGT